MRPRGPGNEDGTRRDTRKPWSGPVTCLPKKWQYLTATRQGVARYSLMKYTSLRAGSLSEREPARIPMMFGCRLSIRMSQVN